MNTVGAFGTLKSQRLITTYLLAGALTAAMYFERDTEEEREIRRIAETLYADRLALGAERRSHSHAMVGSRKRDLSAPVDRYSEALNLVCFLSRIPYLPTSRGQLSRMDQNLQMEESLWT